MDKEQLIKRAAELLKSKSNYVGKGDLAGMEGFVTLALIDENGYPSQSSVTISKTDGIKSMTFFTDINSNKVAKIKKCNKASVSLASPEYMVILKGTIEILTDLESKKANWQQVIEDYYNATPTNEEWCVLKFNTKEYNIFFPDLGDDIEARGTL